MYMSYQWRAEWLNVVRLHKEGIDANVTASMTIPQEEYNEDTDTQRCVTILMDGLLGDYHTVYVYNTDEHGYCNVMVDGGEDYPTHELYGCDELALDPRIDPACIEQIRVDGLPEFIAICQRYMK